MPRNDSAVSARIIAGTASVTVAKRAPTLLSFFMVLLMGKKAAAGLR